MDIERLFQDYNIPYATEGNKHCTEGWVNIHCPFCAGSQGFHLGISTDHGGAHCWRCGGHSAIKVISKILGLPIQNTKTILQKYETKAVRKIHREPEVSIYPIKFPRPNYPLVPKYKKYLEKRGFDPDRLERQWGLLQTGPASFLDNISYSYRILIPIVWGGEMVSFQARDVTDKSDLKYLTCPKKREKIHHKNIVYGKQEILENSDAIIIVEGVTDVWRLGEQAVATFGIEFRMEQVLLLSKFDADFFIVFDDEPQAQKQAKKLSTKLKTLGKRAHVISGIEEDPGSMKQDDADYFVNDLFK